VTITLMNMESRSVLRTITRPTQAPGIISIPWDGRADNGQPVAPGRYLVTAYVRDPRGHEVTRQILGAVQY
jgi:flagellar hook assembly protein FlgD